MERSTKTDRDTSRDLAVIGVRVLDDALITWIAAELDSERALHAWFDAGAPQSADPYCAYRAALDARRRQPATCSGSLS